MTELAYIEKRKKKKEEEKFNSVCKLRLMKQEGLCYSNCLYGAFHLTHLTKHFSADFKLFLYISTQK